MSLFPAYAGVILSFYDDFWHSVSFPRLRGGDPNAYALTVRFTAFSPPTRG